MKELGRIFQNTAAKYDISLSSRQAARLLRYLELLQKKNEQVNLTRIADLEEGLYLHLLDSLFFAQSFIGLQEEGFFEGGIKFVDMGTGGGFPGVPFGIATGEQGVLLDSVLKKVKAVDEMLRELKLGSQMKAEAKRIEEEAKGKPEAFTVALARALAPLEVLLEYASPLLSKEGVLLASKGHPSQEELEAAAIVAPMVGMEYVSRETFELPDGRGHRELFVFQKAHDPKINLPRKAGMAQKRPLSTLTAS